MNQPLSKYLFCSVMLLLAGCKTADGTIGGEIKKDLTAPALPPAPPVPPTPPVPSVIELLNFNTPGEYTLSSNYVEINAGKAKLKTVDSLVNSALEFNAGTHTGTVFAGGILTLDAATSQQNSLIQILPVRENNLEVYWHMEYDWADSSPKNISSTDLNTIYSSAPKIGTYAGAFNGTDSRVEFASVVQNQITISTWTHPVFLSSASYILDTPGFSLIIRSDANIPNEDFRLEFIAKKSNTDGRWLTPPKSFLFSRWHHIGVSYDSMSNSNDPVIILDGVKLVLTELQTPVGTQISNAGTAQLGSSVSLTNKIYGLLDEFAIYNLALKSEEIYRIYNLQAERFSGIYESPVLDMGAAADWPSVALKNILPFHKELTPASEQEVIGDYSSLNSSLTTGLVALWHFNEAATNLTPGGVDVEDSSGLNNHLRDSFGDGSFPDINGVFGRAALFESYASLRAADSASLSITGNMSVQLWARIPLNNLSFATLLSKNLSGDELSYVINFNANGTQVRFLAGTNVYGEYDYASAAYPQDQNWHHIVGVLTATNVLVYIDGRQAASALRTYPTVTDTISPVCIGTLSGGGSSCGGNYFLGVLDEIAIWNRDLNVNEIRELYRRGANKAEYQFRSCASDPCDENAEPWLGSSGSNGSYFSELHNNSSIDAATGLPTGSVSKDPLEVLFTKFGINSQPAQNRYFQYRVKLKANNNLACLDGSSNPIACFPSVSEVAIKPLDRYYGGMPAVQNNIPLNYTKLESLTESATSNCVAYQISNDGISWKFWDGSTWAVASTPQESNALTDWTTPNLAILSYSSYYLKSFLKSNATLTQGCELDEVSITGKK